MPGGILSGAVPHRPIAADVSARDGRLRDAMKGGQPFIFLRPAPSLRRVAGFGRQFKNCAPSAAPKGDGAPIAPRPRESGPRVSGGNQGLPALSRPSGGRRSPERFPLTPSEKADWGRAERGKAAFFSANKKANSLERPFASGKARRLFLFYPVGFLGNARGEYAGATPPAVNRLGVNPFRSRRGNSS